MKLNFWISKRTIFILIPWRYKAVASYSTLSVGYGKYMGSMHYTWTIWIRPYFCRMSILGVLHHLALAN